ncbi:MAG: hypothetical protein NTW50_04775 [Candidatus Berkelbacteria bacterium]|nr:hypothetical protein [Candidatus Berkelbacteria bacterium]
MKTFLLLALVCVCGLARADYELTLIDESTLPKVAVNVPYFGTFNVPIHRVIAPRSLTQADWDGIKEYEKVWHADRMNSDNSNSLRAGLILLLQLDIIHLPIDLRRSSDEIFFISQVIKRMLDRIKWYIALPEFRSATIPEQISPTQLETVTTVKVNLFTAPAPLASLPTTLPIPAPQVDLPPAMVVAIPVRYISITSRPPLSFQKQYAAPARLPETVQGPTEEIRAGLFWYRHHNPTPPTSPTCPPGVTPPQPPVSGTTTPGDPSGPVPGGCPGPAVVPPGVPGTEPNHSTGGLGWDPNVPH